MFFARISAPTRGDLGSYKGREAALRGPPTQGSGATRSARSEMLRSSNTEPLLRLNVESRGDVALVQRRAEEIAGVIGGVSQGGV